MGESQIEGEFGGWFPISIGMEIVDIIWFLGLRFVWILVFGTWNFSGRIPAFAGMTIGELVGREILSTALKYLALRLRTQGVIINPGDIPA